MPKCTIDGKELEVPPGTTVIQAGLMVGIEIPHFCWHPDLAVDGNCRMCLVEIEKMPKLQIACNTMVADGMVVRTTSEKAVQAHRTTLEFLLVNHPIDCPVCDQAGECKLQDYYMDYGAYHSRFPLEAKVEKRKVVDLGPQVVLDLRPQLLFDLRAQLLRDLRLQLDAQTVRQLAPDAIVFERFLLGLGLRRVDLVERLAGAARRAAPPFLAQAGQQHATERAHDSNCSGDGPHVDREQIAGGADRECQRYEQG